MFVIGDHYSGVHYGVDQDKVQEGPVLDYIGATQT